MLTRSHLYMSYPQATLHRKLRVAICVAGRGRRNCSAQSVPGLIYLQAAAYFKKNSDQPACNAVFTTTLQFAVVHSECVPGDDMQNREAVHLLCTAAPGRAAEPVRGYARMASDNFGPFFTPGVPRIRQSQIMMNPPGPPGYLTQYVNKSYMKINAL